MTRSDADPVEDPTSDEPVVAAVDGSSGAVGEPSGEREFISYAEFGQRFFEVAVTRARVTEAVASVAGRPIEFGPLGVGPLGLVKVRANGAVGEPTVTPRDGEHVSFEVAIPVDLQLTIEVGLDKYRFTAAVSVRLAVTARAAEPLQIVIDIEAPTKRTIDVDLHADGLRASVLQLGGLIEGELKRSVAKVARREIEKPELQRALVIDVAAALANLKIGRSSS